MSSEEPIRLRFNWFQASPKRTEAWIQLVRRQTVKPFSALSMRHLGPAVQGDNLNRLFLPSHFTHLHRTGVVVGSPLLLFWLCPESVRTFFSLIEASLGTDR